jgi:general secretion pathway protein A
MAHRPLVNATSAQPPLDNVLPPRRGDEHAPQNAALQPIGGLRPELLFERYGILENPFGVTPNPRYLYQSKTHAEARSSLIIGIECRVGFQALIAPPGMGKTIILFNLLEQFNNVARTAFLFQSHGDSRDFLRHLISELEGEARDSDLVGMQDTINHLLIRERRAGRQTIIVIDEAQSLDTSVLETVRLLSNFETPTEKLVQIILAGQPQLAQRLANPQLAQLHQRISILTTLIPFDLEDTRNYIEHRLKVAGYQGPPLFTPVALRLIWERSGGVPREINTLCFNALLLAIAVEQKQVDSEILREVVADLDLNPVLFNKGTAPPGIRDVQTADVLHLGDAAADPPATSIDKTCKAAVPAAKAEADDASTPPTGLEGVDLAQLGTIVAEIGAASRIERAEQAAARDAKAESDDVVVRAALPDRPALASDRKTATRVVGLPSCESEAAGNSTEVPAFTPETLDPSQANDATTGPHQRPFLTNRRWIAAIAALVIVSSFILGLIIRSLGKRNFELPSISRTEAPRKPKAAKIPPQSLGQRTGGAQDARSPFGMPQQDPRTGRSTVYHTTTESRVRETVVDENPTPGSTVDKSSGQLPNVDEVPNTEDKANSVSESVMSSVPATGIDSRAGLVAHIVPARLIRKVNPVYPPAAQDAQIQGRVILQVIVDKNGAVRDVRFISGPLILAPAAVNAVEHWRYRPSHLNAQPLEWETLVTVKFSSR